MLDLATKQLTTDVSSRNYTL